MLALADYASLLGVLVQEPAGVGRMLESFAKATVRVGWHTR
jgi:hypothetical protein